MSILEKSLKEKYEDFKKNPAALLSLTYPYLLIIGLVVGLIYVTNFNFITRQTVPPALPDTTNTQQGLQIKPAQSIPPVDVTKMESPTQAMLDNGKKLYSANCASCHGADGKGDGPASAGLNPPPRNYTSKDGWINGPKLSGIYKTLDEGISGSAMASYSYMKPQDRLDLAAYIRATYVPDPPKVTDDELANLDLNYNLSQGTETPAQIPVKYAETFVIKDNQGNYDKVMSVMNSIKNDTGSEGAKIFEDITNNKMAALTILVNSPGWKGNQQDFVNLVVNEVHQDGFNDKTLNLSGDQWDTLYKYLSKYF